jgi:hypothetical protein
MYSFNSYYLNISIYVSFPIKVLIHIHVSLILSSLTYNVPFNVQSKLYPYILEQNPLHINIFLSYIYDWWIFFFKINFSQTKTCFNILCILPCNILKVFIFFISDIHILFISNINKLSNGKSNCELSMI